MDTTITIPATYTNGVVNLLRRPYFKVARKIKVVFNVVDKSLENAFAKAAGSWKNIDTETLKKNIYEARKIATRQPINF